MSFPKQDCPGDRVVKEKKSMLNRKDVHNQRRGGQNIESTVSFVPEVFSESRNSQDELVTTDVFGNDIFDLEVTKTGEIGIGIKKDEDEENCQNDGTEIEENIFEQVVRLPFQFDDSFTDSSHIPDLESSMSSMSSSQSEGKSFVRSLIDYQEDQINQASPKHPTTDQSIQQAHSRNHQTQAKSPNGHSHRRTRSSDFEEFCSPACYEENQWEQFCTSTHQCASRRSVPDSGRRTRSGDLSEYFHRKSPVKRSKPRTLSRKQSSRRGAGANNQKTSQQSRVPESNVSTKAENLTKSPIHSRLHQPKSAALHQQNQMVASPNKNKLQRSRSGDACEYHSPNASAGRRRARAILQAGHDQCPESQKRNILQRVRSDECLGGNPGVNSPVLQPRRSKDLQHRDAQPPQKQKCSISPTKSSVHIREKSPKSQERIRLPRVQPEELETFRQLPKRDYNKILSRAPQSNILTRSQSVTLRTQRTSKGLDKTSSERQLEVFMDVNNRSWTAQVPVFEHFDKPAPGPWRTRKESHDSYRRSL